MGEANEPAIYRPSGKINFFRVVPARRYPGRSRRAVGQELGIKKVFILHDRELYGKGVADVFKRSCIKLGITVVGYEGIDPKAANYRSAHDQSQKHRCRHGVLRRHDADECAASWPRTSCLSARAQSSWSPIGCREHALIESAGKDNLDDRTYVTFSGLPPSQLKGRGREFYDN